MTQEEKKHEAGVASPLLETVTVNDMSFEDQSRSGRGGASFFGAVFNVTTTMIGAGIMSIPATMKVLGIIPGLVLIIAAAAMVEVTAEFLLRYTNSGEAETYATTVAESFGRLGFVTVEICVIVTNLGCLIIYFIIVGDVLCGSQSGETMHIGILQEWFGFQWWNTRAYSLLFVTLFVMLPLVMLRRIDSLRHSSAVSILLALVFVAISSSMAIYALCKGKTPELRLFPDFDKVSVFDLFTTVPIFVTGFGFHVNVHPIRAELSKPCDMKRAIRISLAIGIALYFAIGFSGYLLFGDSIMADILVNFDQNSGSVVGRFLNDIVRLSYAIHLLLVFPIMNFSLRVNIDELVFPERPSLASDTPRFVSLTLVLLFVTYVVSIAIPNIWYFFQFMGSTTVAFLSFIFPGALILRDVHGISTRKDKIVALLVMILAVLTSSIAVSTNLKNLTKD